MMMTSDLTICAPRLTKRGLLLAQFLGWGILLFLASTLSAADESAKEATKPLKIPWLDEEIQPLVPLQPRTQAMQDVVNAQAWYMTGRFLQGRNDFRGAFDAYRKAADLAPDSLPVYQALVPLAFSLNQTAEAVRYAMRAVELDPNDYRLLRQLGVYMASQRKYAEGVKLIVQATKSNRINKRSAVYIQLQRDLAILYLAMKDVERSADAYAIIFEALQNPGKYQLDFSMRSVLSADPRTSYEAIGQAFLKAKRMDKAVKAFELAAKSPRGKPGLLSYNLAQVYQATGKHKQARSELKKYLDAKLQEKGIAAYELLAEILKSQNQSQLLQKEIEQLAKQDPENPQLHLFLGNLYLKNKQLELAEKTYLKSLKITESVQGYIGLLAVYRELQRPEDLMNTAASILKVRRNFEDPQLEAEMKALGANKKLIDNLIKIGREWAAGDEPRLKYAHAFFLSRLASAAKNTAATVEFYRYALKVRPAEAARLFDELGEYLLFQKEYDQAAAIYQEAIANPNIAGAKANFLFRISQAYEFGGKTEAALKAIREAREIIPTLPLLHYQEGWIHYHSRQYDKAVKVFEEVIKKYPQQPDIARRCRFSLSNIYIKQGNLRKGEEVLEEVYKQQPDDPGVNNDLGYLYADHGKNLEQAEEMIRKALKAEPDNPAYLDSMGWVLYKRGKYQEALPYLQKAVENPTGGDATLWDHLGDIYSKLKQIDKAKEVWNKALEDARKETPADEELIKKIEQKLKSLIKS